MLKQIKPEIDSEGIPWCSPKCPWCPLTGNKWHPAQTGDICIPKVKEMAKKLMGIDKTVKRISDNIRKWYKENKK